jgi:hypothetical protein
MKTSSAIRQAIKLHNKINEIMRPHSRLLAEILDDDCAHFGFQPGDGCVVVYRGGSDNASVTLLNINIDALMLIDEKEKAIEILDRAGI